MYAYTFHNINSISGSDGRHSSVKSTASEGSCSLTTVDLKSFKDTWNQEIRHNKETWKAHAAKDFEENAKKGAVAQEENEAEEETESKKIVDRPSTGHEEMKTDAEEQEEVENRRQQEKRQPKEKRDNNPGRTEASLQGSKPSYMDKKKPDSHTGTQLQQCQNDPQPDCPPVHYYKRPSYCAGTYRLLKSKVTDIQPIDARWKARKLQCISLRRRK
uniref:calcium/calmodulin-dependent 3',5'-cyclic nucleotide phosphodiesterase 1C-like n=1 Tax=Scatophagus argus TaxID=75038 RepID=UPI001ED7F83C|nr:calcium/calmodulin-dependent 3',5'-cyclic nucleotide phosphodiesterase 1C-like [Scatophagus argus]